MVVFEHMKLDEKDKKILNILVDNANWSYRKIAKPAKLSVATIIKRVKNLEKRGLIRKYSAILNYEKADYDVVVIIEMRISKGKLHQVEQKIASHPNVFGVYDHTGTFDATILARFKNRRKMDEFLKKIQTYDFVERTESKLVLNSIKEEPQKVK